MSDAVEIFLSYSRKDEKLLQDFKIHLTSLRLSGYASLWHDGLIVPGQGWDDEIKENLDRSKIIILLISKYFIQSKYCQEVELARAYERYEAGKACIIPVILRHCSWKKIPFGRKTLGDLQALPRNVKPITDWQNRDKAFTTIVEEIQAIIENQRITILNKLDSSPEGNESSLDEIWNEVISVLQPLGTRALLQQQGKLVDLSEGMAQIEINSKPLLKMAQGRTAHVEKAFYKVLGYQVKTHIFYELDLIELWEKVISVLEPLGTRSLMQQQGNLLSFDGRIARVEISSRPLFKMASDRVSNVEAAFYKVLGHEVEVYLE